MYLSKIHVRNFRGITNLEVMFEKKLNIFIGENGCNKTALIDAIRLLYNLGNPKKDIYVVAEDFFYEHGKGNSKQIEIIYCFHGLSTSEKGALYEYLVVSPTNPSEDYARITLRYEYRESSYPKFSYFTGNNEEQKADSRTFDIFQHYYLGALRDSTADLLNVRTNALGGVIKRLVERKGSEKDYQKIMQDANEAILKQQEVKDTKLNVNNHLDQIFKISKENQIGLRIEQASKIEGIVNLIKPYLPHDKTLLENEGFHLWQNSLGFNNLIYTTIILGDIRERLKDNPNQHFILLIEEPEAHLHPQLQLSLYNFLRSAGSPPNCQLFITSHSPTLTSKADLDSITVLRKEAINIGECFADRVSENIVENVLQKKKMTDEDFKGRKKQLERYLDVTKCQLFFAKGILFVEGISEKLLVKAFSEFISKKIEDYKCEIVSVEGISFNPFIHLFNSMNDKKRLPHNASIITDDDRLSKEKSTFKTLTKNTYSNLNAYHRKLYKANLPNRIWNLKSTLINSQNNIQLYTAFRTLEFEISLANIERTKTLFETNFLINFLAKVDARKYGVIIKYVTSCPDEIFTQEEREKIAILVWKALPSKAEFAQDFSLALEEAILTTHPVVFTVPKYLADAITHSTN